MTETIVIARRYCGPPESGHGGYSCGCVAELIGSPAASVSLRAPPPLERELEVRRADGAVRLFADDQLVAEGVPAELEVAVPEPVPLPVAMEADLTGRWPHNHPFPTCFGCGIERSRDEAIALIPGPVEGREVLAAPWTPLPYMADHEGIVTARFLWAALDCPTGFPFIAPGMPPHALARLAARPGPTPVIAGRPHVVVAWRIGRDGRKGRGGAAVFTDDGRLCGISEGLWIALRDPSALGARGSN